MEEMMFGVGRDDVCSLAFQLAERNGLSHPFKNEKAGKHWIQKFLECNPVLSLRTPEATSAARARGFNKDAVMTFFNILESLLVEYNFARNNCDETGISTVQSKPSKILALKGRRQVGTLTSAERGTLVTTEICMSATGAFIPLFIFPRVRMRP